MVPFEVGAERFALLLGLSLFFGFAFEGFYSDEMPRRPGGVRTFPLLALAGGGLFLLEPHYGAAFIAGLFVVGSWMYAYIRYVTSTQEKPPEGLSIIPVCNLLAYLLGPIALTQPLWLAVTLAVAAVLLLGGRRKLHDWAQRVSGAEIITAGQFLILVGIVLPLLAGKPTIPYTSVTPFGVWLAVVAVSSISYASYLLQRYVFSGRTTLLMSILGGLYSSTATTVVLSRRSREEGMTPEVQAGILAASAMMYLRILVICSLFNAGLGRILIVPLLGLALLSALVAAWRSRAGTRSATVAEPSNPLQVWTALVFAALFVVISILTNFAQSRLGHAGIYALASIVGVTDIDPFVLSLAQGGAAGMGLATAATAIIIATSSNNLLKAVYCVLFSRRRESWIPAIALGAIAALGIAIAFLKPL
ncbi:MAG TPA: DUF4010 domain-containing protein [Candidatus Cybelea sp.]|nr:DUF4010 domain-containing protein [Candidatus Cybelea sp.]